MKKIGLFTLLIITLQISAQTKKLPCASDNVHLKLIQNNPEYKRRFEKSNADWQEFAPKHMGDWKKRTDKNFNARLPTAATTTLNIVFHDISAGSTHLLSLGSSLNDYNYIVDGLNAVFDGTNLLPANLNLGNDTAIRFCQALKDIHGDSYKVFDNQESNFPSSVGVGSSDFNQHAAIATACQTSDFFPPQNYINIYIVDDILEVAGFAYMPGAVEQPADGIFIERSALNVNHPDYDASMNTLAHEMGHYLGLFHTFGICSIDYLESFPANTYIPCSCDNNNCLYNGDMVCDTPPNQLRMGGYSQPWTLNTCATDGIPYYPLGTSTNVNPIPEMTDPVDPKENYMDYGYAQFHRLFTDGQIERMHFMIDPLVGPRKMLVGSSACVNCSLMNNCDFNIGSSPSLLDFNGREAIWQGPGGITPAVDFIMEMSCDVNSPTMIYSWSLQLLSDTVASGTDNPYTTPSDLEGGNYVLTMTATLSTNPQCFETATYKFTVIPAAGPCNFDLPVSNSATDWSSADWIRKTSSNGWNCRPGALHAYDGETGFDPTGFDVIPIAPLGTIPGDALLGSFPLNANANISSVIRVGLTDNGGGKAFYAKKSILINRNNCRFKVWVLGASNAYSGIYPFQNAASGNNSAFGISSLYEYRSPAGPNVGGYNAVIGSDETCDTNPPIMRNNIVSGLNFPLIFDSASGSFITNGWREVILDYSDYVDLNTGTDTRITLTFFAHPNVEIGSFQDAYGYFGIECLGGGIPTPFIFDVPNVSVPCANPDTFSCVYVDINRPPYIVQDEYYNDPLYYSHNVALFEIVDGTVSTTPFPFTFVNNSMKICLDQHSVPSRRFRIVYTTLHETINRDFSIFTGFFTTTDHCPSGTFGDRIDPAFHGTDVTTNAHILLCGTDNLPVLHLTPTCVQGPFTYQWYDHTASGDFKIPDATSQNLQLTYDPLEPVNGSNYTPYNCKNYFRKTIYKDPYCGSEREKLSDSFYVYNSQALFLRFDSTTSNNVCFGDTYEITLNNPRLSSSPYIEFCSFPQHLLSQVTDISNHLTFQLINHASQQPFGNAIPYDFTGLFTPGSILPLTFHFIYDTNPDSGTPLFVPTSAINSTVFPFDIRISGTYLGCELDEVVHTKHLEEIEMQPSAVGGQIAYNCTGGNISSVNDGITFWGYAWEYSTDNNAFIPIPSGPATNNLALSYITNLISSNPMITLFIRRKSKGTSQCPSPNYSNVVVITSNAPSSIQFNATTLPSSICQGMTAPVLPKISDNGVIGAWFATSASNQITETYTFTPLEGYCLPPYVYTLNVSNGIIPNFTQIGPFCAGESFSLPPTSNNEYSGIWLPAVDNTTTRTYTFMPTTGTVCGPPVTMTVTINQSTEVSFAENNLFSVICYGGAVPLLPNFDDNDVEGRWSPLPVSNTETSTYTFTPLNDCIAPASYIIGVVQGCGVTISWGSEVSCETADEMMKFNVDIADGPCIRVCENSRITYQLNSSAPIISTIWNVTGGTILNQTATNCEILWNNSTFCALQGVVQISGGTEFYINKCIEKLEAPHAAFSIATVAVGQSYTTCTKSLINFHNYSSADTGDDNLYYNWYFGDGTTSNEFEPSHAYMNAGNYEVTLVVTNGCSCVGKSAIIVYVSDGEMRIDCPSIVCEGNVSHYAINSHYASCTDLVWQVTGGSIIAQQNSNTKIDVLWNNVDSDGFGYINVTAASCNSCSTQIKVPVVKQVGTIKGDAAVCQKTQNLYSLPQWPTTDFNWTVDDHGTGAFLILTTQRNEILLRAVSGGTVDLYCNYYNTLLDCGGTAHFTIQVYPVVGVNGDATICFGQTGSYQVVDAFGSILPGAAWIANGPNSFEQTGTGSPFTITFPNPGIYNIVPTNPTQCDLIPMHVSVLSVAQLPTSIIGPLVVCPGNPVQYSVAVPSNTVAHWSVVNGSIFGSSTGSSILVNFNSAAVTPFLVNVWFESALCSTGILTTTIDREVPDLTIIDEDVLVCGSSYADYAINNANADSYSWSISPPSAGSIESGQNTSAIHVLWNQQAQIATVTLRLLKCGRPYDIAPITVTIINAPAITISGPISICSGQNAQFTFSQTPAGTFTNVVWDFGDGVVTPPSNAYGIGHIYQAPPNGLTDYTVTATVTRGNGCLMEGTATANITVSPRPLIGVTPSLNYNHCQISGPLQNSIYAVTIQGGFASTDTILWYGPTGTVPGLAGSPAEIDLSVLPVGTYYATVENTYHCIATTENITIIDNCAGCNAPEIVDFIVTELGCQRIRATTTLLPAGYTSATWAFNLPGATIVHNDASTYFEAENLVPGLYTIGLRAYYTVGGQSCGSFTEKTIKVPYKADLKYQVTCNGNGTYHVSLLDFSSYYPGSQPDNYWFTVDGSSWYNSTVGISGIREYVTNLPPGIYQIGIRIYKNGHYPCEKTMTLVLPAMPNADFTYPTSVCLNSPAQFHVINPNPNYHYLWGFGDGSENLQQDPVKTFSTPGFKTITLKITNQYGCEGLSSHILNVFDINMNGDLQVTPAAVCEGGLVSLHYQPNSLTVTPNEYVWYQSVVTTTTPFANTAPPNPDLTVTQNGYYIIYVRDSNGCLVTTTRAVTVAFVPLPETPKISGSGIVCSGNPISLSIAGSSDLVYEWTRDNVIQPQWENNYFIEDYQSTPGVYTYTVTPKVLASPGTYCSGIPATITVTVVVAPDMPVLSLSMITCVPYKVGIEVTNPQTDVGYYWSNGATGSETFMLHDGPLQVHAIINECSVKNQLDLPTDLEVLSWIFPKGCFEGCDKPSGTVLGPLGDFENWQWLADQNSVLEGTGSVPPLNNFESNTNYSMNLDSGYCALETGSMNYKKLECEKCQFIIVVKDVTCVTFNNQTIYEVKLDITNPGAAVSGVFTAPNGYGYFTPNTVLLPAGFSSQILLFTGQAGFTGGAIDIYLTSQSRGATCKDKFIIDFPKDCQSIEECKFDNKLKELSCVKSDYGNIYHIGLQISNPYPITATTVVSIPSSMGTLSPSTVLATTGISYHNFYFYPSATFSGSTLPFTVVNTIGTVSCFKVLELQLPELCTTVKICDVECKIEQIKCHIMPNGQYGYLMTMNVLSSFGAAGTLTFSAPYAEGYFQPTIVNIPTGSSTHTLSFYPTNGYIGGTILLSAEGHFLNRICISDQYEWFPAPCCQSCRTVDLSDPKVTVNNLLVVAPNPASARTTIFYNFVESNSKKEMVLTDALGRVLQEWNLNESKGTIEVDCIRYAQGHYFVIMKSDGMVVKNSKLIKD